MASPGWWSTWSEDYTRSSGGLLAATLAPVLVLGLLAIMEGVWRGHRRRAVLAADPQSLHLPVRVWAGLRVGGVVVGLTLIVLVGYPLLFPTAPRPGGYRAAVVLRAAAAVGSAAVVLVQVGRYWNAKSAGLALGLLTLAGCTLATWFVPAERGEPAPRYPLLLNALVMALGLMTWFWSWLAQVWQQQRGRGLRNAECGMRIEEPSAETQGGEKTGEYAPAWTTAGRLVPVNRRCSWVTGVSGLALALLLALWPVGSTCSACEASLGRISAGLAAHLVLLLALLGGARRERRSAFYLLSVLVLLSTATFLLVRLG